MNKKIEELKVELFDLRMKQATGNLDNPHIIDVLRKTIASIKSVLYENDWSEN